MKFLTVAWLIGLVFGRRKNIVFVYEAADTGLLKGTYKTILDDTIKAIDGIARKYPGVLIGAGTFVDKPRPVVGVGTYGGYPEDFVVDWCWNRLQKLTTEATLIQAKLLRAGIGAGMDELNGVFDAIVLAAEDSTLGWVEGDEKILIIITDSFGHSADFAGLTRELDYFNTPVRCDPVNQAYTYGGYRAQIPDRGALPITLWHNYRYVDEYKELQDLMFIRTCAPREMTQEEFDRFDELNEKLGPVRVPYPEEFDVQKLQTDPLFQCELAEYPNYEQIVEVLKRNSIKLIVVYAGPDKPSGNLNLESARAASIADTWRWTMSDVTALGSVPNILIDLTQSNWLGLEDQVLAAIDELSTIDY